MRKSCVGMRGPGQAWDPWRTQGWMWGRHGWWTQQLPSEQMHHVERITVSDLAVEDKSQTEHTRVLERDVPHQLLDRISTPSAAASETMELSRGRDSLPGQ